ncbi:MAG: DUF222 domain-containing protein [Woeseiaceae bacterium]
MNTHSNAHALTDTHASIDDLDRAIGNLAARINASTHDFLVLIRRFDERAGWLRWSFDNCADWLHYRCDISRSAAREKVRVAHAMKALPAIAMAFAKGELSYSKVRALTRVARPDSEDELLTFALNTTASRVEERCRELRCGTTASTDDAVRAHARRELRMRRDDARGTITITVELPFETGELVDKALDRSMEASAASDPEFSEESWNAQRADALVQMAKAYLAGDAEGVSDTPDHYQVTVHVDESALRGSAGGRSGLPIETVRRIACDSDLIVLVRDKDGNPLSVGRKTRVVPIAIERALWARDKGCRFPGCGRKRYVHAHHIVHWSAGGVTSLANLMLLCSKHHTLLHEGGYTIEKDYKDRWFFRRPDGRAVPACGYRPEDVTDNDAETAAEYFHGRASAEALRASAEASGHSAEGWMVGEPQADVYWSASKFARQTPPLKHLRTVCAPYSSKRPVASRSRSYRLVSENGGNQDSRRTVQSS